MREKRAQDQMKTAAVVPMTRVGISAPRARVARRRVVIMAMERVVIATVRTKVVKRRRGSAVKRRRVKRKD